MTDPLDDLREKLRENVYGGPRWPKVELEAALAAVDEAARLTREQIVAMLRERAASTRSKDHGWDALADAADLIEQGGTDGTR